MLAYIHVTCVFVCATHTHTNTHVHAHVFYCAFLILLMDNDYSKIVNTYALNIVSFVWAGDKTLQRAVVD